MFYRETEPVSRDEMWSASLSRILGRFGYRNEGESGLVESWVSSWFSQELLRRHGGEFELLVEADNCPFIQLVLVGAVAAGLNKPEQIERFKRVLCGQMVERVNDMGWAGPLSGRDGTEYKPLSGCWRVTVELWRLVQFMKTEEIMPEVVRGLDEDELAQVLVERKRVRENVTKKGMVFSYWQQLMEKWSGWGFEGENLKLESGEVVVDANRVAVEKQVLDVSGQLDVGGPEYVAAVGWVEKRILQPLIDLVGEDNLALYIGAESFRLGMQKTAENCSKRPRSHFVGRIS